MQVRDGNVKAAEKALGVDISPDVRMLPSEFPVGKEGVEDGGRPWPRYDIFYIRIDC